MVVWCLCCDGCVVSLQCWVGSEGTGWGERGMWRNEGGWKDGANLGLLLARSFGRWPLKLLVCVKVVSFQPCPLLCLQWHILNLSTNWFGSLKKQNGTLDKPTDKSPQCSSSWMTWPGPQRSYTSSNTGGGGPAELGEDEVGKEGG